MTNGGPAGVTRPVVQYIFETGFTGYRFGYASAIAYIFFALIVIISIGQVRFDVPQERLTTAIATEPTTQPTGPPPPRPVRRARGPAHRRDASPAPAASGRSSPSSCSPSLWLLPFLWARRHVVQVRDGSPPRRRCRGSRPTASPRRRTRACCAQGNIPLWTWNSLVTATAITLHHARRVVARGLRARADRLRGPPVAVLGDHRVDHRAAARADRAAVLRDADAQPRRHLLGDHPAAGRRARHGVHPEEVLRAGARSSSRTPPASTAPDGCGCSGPSSCRCPGRSSRPSGSSCSSRRGTTSCGRSSSPATRRS